MRVLLCRAAPDCDRTALRLTEAGHTGLIAPVLAIEPLAPGHPLTGHDALLVTSSHAVTNLTDAQAHALAACPLYAVGQHTALAARERGFRDVRIGSGDGNGLVGLFCLTLPPHARVLHLAGRDRKPDVGLALAARGYRLTTIETYVANPAPWWTATILDDITAGRVAACLHFSRRSAMLSLAFAAKGDVSDNFAALHHVCMSRDAASPLSDAGVRRITIADAPSEAAMIRAIAAPHLTEGPPPNISP